jgi:hypothetical protein
VAAAWLAVLPSLTMAQLLEHMDPSQSAAVKAAAARELARRLRQDGGAKPFEASPEGVSRLVQLLAEAEERDTQLAALEALVAVFRWCGDDDFLCQQLDQLPGFADALVRVLHELPAVGDEDMQAEIMEAVARLIGNGTVPQALGPSPSHPNSWPAASALVAVLQSPAVSTWCKGHAAEAVYWLLHRLRHPTAAEHPAMQAAVGPLVALLQAEERGVQGSAAAVIGKLAEGHPANQSLIGAEPGAISRLWQLGLCGTLADVVEGHGINQSRLLAQDGFMGQLLDLLGSDRSNFSSVAEALQDNSECILRLCDIPTVVPLLTAALRPESNWETRVILGLLLSMCKADPSTIRTFSSQPGMVDKLQQLSDINNVDGKPRFPDASSLCSWCGC